jgi:Rieske 2Fe-2S family protein
MRHFDPQPATAGPLEQTLPSRYYRSEEIYARERERIFCREWICVGRETELLNAGDSKVLDVLGESVLLVRNEVGALRGFYNVCRHRGAQLCGTVLPGRATAGGVAGKRIRCPYHSWSYSFDGDLVATPYVDGVDRTRFSLYPVGVETWGGFIFVHLMPSLPNR